MASVFPFGWVHYLAGGILIGAAVSLLFVLTGWIGGMSGVFSSTWSYVSRLGFFGQARFVDTRAWRLLVALGLVLGAAIWWAWLGPAGGVHTSLPLWQLGVGGLIGGFGARLSNGCTSGHGICGLSSLQLPSLAAVVVFMATGFMTARLVLLVGGR